MRALRARQGSPGRVRPGRTFTFLPERLASLDGLRGIAALVVLVHHEAMTVPTLAASYYESGVQPAPFSPAWWLAFTPLHLAWAGTEAVFLFFILSGVVLVLPALRTRGFDWVAYYPRRLVRIYGPVACAVAFGFALQWVLPRFNDHRLGRWVVDRPNDTGVHDLLKDLTLMQGTSGLVSPLWSLRWEVVFSALLPLFVALAIVARRFLAVALLGTLGVIAVGSALDVDNLFYVPMFAIGALLVGSWDRVAVVARALARRRWPYPVLLATAALVGTVSWWAQAFGVSKHDAQAAVWLELPAVVALLLAAAFWPPLRRLLEARPVQWLGRISFSLYLVHEPIVISARLALFHWQLPTWVSIAVSAPVALLVAHCFARFVEAPFHRLSRTVGRSVAGAAGEVLPGPQRPAPAEREPARTAEREREPSYA